MSWNGIKIETSGDLRKFLCTQLVGIKNGDLEIAKASQITKMAEQITNSLYAEMKMQQLQMLASKSYHSIGDMPLGAESSVPAIEAPKQ